MDRDIIKEYENIDILFRNGEIIKSLKKQCNLIIKNNCSTDILIDYRKKLYATFITGNNGMTDDAIIMFKYAIEKCTLENLKLNIPFIKKAIYYLEQKSNPDYNEINKWLNYYDVDSLSNSVYGNNKYSDRELYYLKKAKVLDLINKEEELENLLNEYINNNQNNEIIFFIKYHICRLNFVNGNCEKANKYLKELLIVNREKYVLGLPIKYLDYSNESNTILLIIELLLERKLDDYFYAYILNWLKNSKFKFIVETLDDCYKYENKKYNILNYKKLKKNIILNIINDRNLGNLIKCGKIVNITKCKNAFIYDGSINIFVDKKYVDKKIKLGDTVRYFVIERYNIEKNTNLSQAIIVEIGGNYEILCSKKGK